MLDNRIATTPIVKLCPKLIIEGTRLTGKTDLALALNEHPRIGRNPESFAEARARRLQISSNPSQYDDLKIFIRKREIFQQLAQDSAIPKLLVDVTD